MPYTKEQVAANRAARASIKRAGVQAKNERLKKLREDRLSAIAKRKASKISPAMGLEQRIQTAEEIRIARVIIKQESDDEKESIRAHYRELVAERQEAMKLANRESRNAMNDQILKFSALTRVRMRKPLKKSPKPGA